MLPFEQIDIRSPELNQLRKNTVFYSNSRLNGGKSLSRIVLFQSGANRCYRMPESPPPENELKRHKYDIVTFSYGSRSRYYSYINSLKLDGFSVYILTMTITNNIFELLTLDNFRLICKKFYRYLIKSGFDYIYKLEFTLGCSHRDEFISLNKKGCFYECSSCDFKNDLKPMPHLHIVIYTQKPPLFSKDFTVRDKASEISHIWTDIIFDCVGLGFFRSVVSDCENIYNDMLAHSCFLEIPKDLKAKIFYLSYYFTKDKEYQNIIPEKFIGLKMWGYGRENYKDIKVPPVEIEITQEIYDEIYRQAQHLALLKKRENCPEKDNYKNCNSCPSINFCRMYKKNGVYHKDIIQFLNAFKKNNRFETMKFQGDYEKMVEKIKASELM